MADATGQALILVTNVYPYRTGEEFLEAEIPALADAFQRVTVVCCQVGEGEEPTRRVPENVTVVPAGAPRTRSALVRRGLGGLGPLVAGRKGLIGKPGFAAKEALFEGTAREIVSRLSWGQLNLGDSRAVSIMAYWFHVPARVATLMAERIRKAGTPVTTVVSRGHGFDVYAERHPDGRLPLRKELLAGLDGVYVCSQHGRDAVRAAHPEHATKVSTAYLGTRDPGRRAVLSRDPLHVVTLAWVSPLKRLDRLAAPLAAIGAQRPVRWTHIGGGDGLSQLRDHAVALLGEDAVSFIGPVPNAEISTTLAGLRPSCLASLSTSEGLPVSIMEASALGIPTIATTVGGVPEVVHDGVSGLLLDADFQDNDLVAALRVLAGLDEETYQSWSDAARGVWEQNFDAAVNFAAFAASLRA